MSIDMTPYGRYPDDDRYPQDEQGRDQDDGDLDGGLDGAAENTAGHDGGAGQTETAGSANRERKPASRHAVRKVVAKTLAVVEASEPVRRLVASQIGVKKTEAFALSVAVLSVQGRPAGLQPVQDRMGQGREEVLFALFGASRQQRREVWSVLRGLDLVEGGLPVQEVGAARQIVDLVSGMSSEHRRTVVEAIALIQG